VSQGPENGRPTGTAQYRKGMNRPVGVAKWAGDNRCERGRKSVPLENRRHAQSLTGWPAQGERFCWSGALRITTTH